MGRITKKGKTMTKKLKTLIQKHSELQNTPYGKERNAALWDVQDKLTLLGYHNRNGMLVRAPGALGTGNSRRLTAQRTG
jgi:hypothetical protein